jgi:hypothetical protein
MGVLHPASDLENKSTPARTIMACAEDELQKSQSQAVALLSRPAVKSGWRRRRPHPKHYMIATLGLRSLEYEERCKEW